MGRGLDVLAALAAPPVVVGYLVVAGARPPTDVHNTWLMVGVLATLGAGLSLAVRASLRVAPALAVARLLVLPWTPLFAGGPFYRLQEFLADVLLLAVCFFLLAGVEYALRNPDAVDELFTPRAVRAAVIAGLGLCLVAAGVRIALGFGWGRGAFGLASSLWMLGGTAVLGALTGVLAVRFGLVAPPALVLGLFAGAVLDTWRDVAGAGAGGAALSSLSVFMLGWFGPAVLALVVGYAEYVVRENRTRD